ncbi:PREDICTED: elongation of very long chain fatty acids protein 4 [Dufourea novaeangliae]|uniref:elongation of very long chain fatty acids protein 4 n=1 Tax=Dufourea novaeangliae TaxID=178035 RepID=UPI0007679673|nr:PREDICTED: elongation of very long chain fatty acids protein 4 [Dufourea novaeangliae]
MGLTDVYHHYNTELADKMTNHWALISSPVLVTIFSILYLYFILDWGPKYMKDKKPYSFKTFIFWYNIFQIIANSLIIQQAIAAGWYSDGYMGCPEIDYSNDYNIYKMASTVWYLLYMKLIDYIETILYVLRKKNRQISALHVYHHVSTMYFTWLAVKYYPNGHAMTVAVVNCGIHVIMYTYYLLASLGGNIQKLIEPFKPFLTLAQMIQFIALIMYALQAFLPYCSASRLGASLMIADLAINFGMFFNFYMQNYMKKNKKSID